MDSSYSRPLPALIQRPSSNVTAQRPLTEPPAQGMPNAQDQQAQMMMMLLAMLAAGGQGGMAPGAALPPEMAAAAQPPMPGGMPGEPGLL